LERKNLETEVLKYGKLLGSETSEFQIVSENLYSRLIDPLLNKIQTKNLIIIKHGILHYLPFNALKKNNNFLIETFQISHLPSSTLINESINIFSDNHPLLALGNPDIADKIYDLPFAEEEVKQIGGIFKNSSILVRGKATKNNLLQLVEKAKFIHIASHGIFNKSDPLSSGLLLAGNPFEEIADVLTARELYSLKFNADLITLSACDTGLGKISNGDDVLGLVRGFIFSGAKNIISTLWPIDDEFTKKLMVNFYTVHFILLQMMMLYLCLKILV
jgi:CHAT domain-containing protein